MDIDKKTKVKEYINDNEQTKWYWKFVETIADLTWVEKETKESFLTNWLKNDDDLLAYAELAIKTEKLNFWEILKQRLLELKLSVACPYFEDFKEFLKELKRWNDTSDSTSTSDTKSASEFNENISHTFCGIDINNIKSEPFQKDSTTGVTWCSKTAIYNWKNFNVDLPCGNAYDAGKKPWKDCLTTIPSDKQDERPQNKREWLTADKFKSIWKWNYADIYTNSKSNYGHRASAFKDDKWERYVLDPYTRVNWKLDNSPKKLNDYLSVRKIVKANIYESSWYKSPEISNSKKSQEWENLSTDSNIESVNWKVAKACQIAIDIANDNSYWYEWWTTGNKNGRKWFDCQSFVRHCYIGTWINVPPSWWCSTMKRDFEKVWFECITFNKNERLKPWDILVDPQKHTEICVWENKIAWAHSNKDKKAWDGGWEEISVRTVKSSLSYRNPKYILRYKWDLT